jgi:hypothetical protein
MEMQVVNDAELEEEQGDYSNFVLIEDAQPHTIQRFEEKERKSRDVGRLRHLELCKVSIPLCKLISISWVHHAMEIDVQMMYGGFDHGYVNQISFYVCLCDVDGDKRLVEIESMSPI